MLLNLPLQTVKTILLVLSWTPLTLAETLVSWCLWTMYQVGSYIMPLLSMKPMISTESVKDKFALHSITCDGRRGLLGGFGDIPTQTCHFHQIAIVRRYLTKNPKHKSSQEPLLLVKSPTTSNKQCFGKALDEWYDKHKDYLNERTTNDESKSRYTHKRLGRACLLYLQ